MTRDMSEFDPKKPLIMVAPRLVCGHTLKRGQAIPDDVPDDIKGMMWGSETADYADDYLPTPVEKMEVGTVEEEEPVAPVPPIPPVAS